MSSKHKIHLKNLGISVVSACMPSHLMVIPRQVTILTLTFVSVMSDKPNHSKKFPQNHRNLASTGR